MRTALLIGGDRADAGIGPAGLTRAQHHRRAGCSTTGVYTYFGGKQGLVEAIFVEGFESFDRATGPCLACRRHAPAGRAYRRWALANPIHYMVMFGRAVPDFVPSEPARVRARESFAALAETVRRGSTPATTTSPRLPLLRHRARLRDARVGRDGRPAGDDLAEQLYEAAVERLAATG